MSEIYAGKQNYFFIGMEEYYKINYLTLENLPTHHL